MFDKRMKFKNNGEIQNKITFSSSYYCWNFLPKQIIMEELKIHLERIRMFTVSKPAQVLIKGEQI